MSDKEISKIIIVPDTSDIQKHGLVPGSIPIVDIKPNDNSGNGDSQSNNDSDKK